MLHFHFHLNEDERGKINEVANFFFFICSVSQIVQKSADD